MSDLKNLGMVAIKNAKYQRYLQAHADNGETHCSNPKHNTEETWFIWEIDKGNKIYAIQNWANGNFLRWKPDGCARADSALLTITEQWRFVSGPQYGQLNAVAFISVKSGHSLGTQNPGNDLPCGGEVGAGVGRLSTPSVPEPGQDPNQFPFWWILEPTDKPEEGKNVWNTIGGFFMGLVNNIKPADVLAILAAVA